MPADLRHLRMQVVTATMEEAEAARELELARALLDGQAHAPEMAWDRYARWYTGS